MVRCSCSHLEESYWPWVGAAVVTAVNGESGTPIANALAVVSYNKTSHVTRKRTSHDGTFAFGGWVGRARRAPHTIVLTAAGFADATTDVQLIAGGSTPFVVRMTPVAVDL